MTATPVRADARRRFPTVRSSALTPSRPARVDAPDGGLPADVRRPLGPSEDVVVRKAARAAEDAGDLAGAARLVSVLPPDEMSSRWSGQLAARCALPADAAPYVRGVCLLGPAQRWAAEGPGRQAMLQLAQATLRTGPGSAAEREARSSLLAAFDPLVADIALFDDDMLNAYLQHALSPAVLSRCGPVAEWGQVPGTVFEVLATGDGSSSLVRPVLTPAHPDGETSASPVRVLGPAGAPGELLYGRAVGAGIGELVFALPPVPLTPVHAGRVQRCLLRRSPAVERIRLLARAAG